MVQVHHFKVWNSRKGDWEIPPSKRMADNIYKLEGQIIPDTLEEVDITQLDKDGRYFPSGSAAQVDRPMDEDMKKKRPK